MNCGRILPLIGVAVLMTMLGNCVQAETAPRQSSWVTFGNYYYDSDGTRQPVLWRVLGPGVPEETDVMNEKNHIKYNANDLKRANGDPSTPENRDLYCLMTEYIVDFLVYNETRDALNRTPPLDYADSLIYRTLRDQVTGEMFTPEELTALEEMPGRGVISLPSRQGELFREDYGFVEEDFIVWKDRITVGTPYAYKRGLKRVDRHSWYWTTDWRRYGFRWIVGDDGHISVSGVDRGGGVRLVCYLHMDRVHAVSGSGTLEDPWNLEVRELQPSESAPDSPYEAPTDQEATPAEMEKVPDNEEKATEVKEKEQEATPAETTVTESPDEEEKTTEVKEEEQEVTSAEMTELPDNKGTVTGDKIVETTVWHKI